MSATCTRRWTTLIAVIAVLAIGCTPTDDLPPKEVAAGWPQQLKDFTMTWDAEAGIDLTRGPAVVVRAYEESFYLARITNDDKYLYPGFRRAVESNQSGGPKGTESLWPEKSQSSVWIGTVRHRFLRLDSGQTGIVALVCAYTYGSGSQYLSGYAANIGTDRELNSGIYPLRVGLRAPDQEQDGAPQFGPERAATTDVFGDWKVTSHLGGYMTNSRWKEYDADRDACIAHADGPPESRHFLPGGGRSRDDFPTRPAVPGWPQAKG